jgi:uncharacterized membrane protein
MTEWTWAAPTVLASFLASTVEFIEALTIVLAVGLTRGWRWALIGSAAGVALLAALVLGLGSSLRVVPLAVLQQVVGVLLLMFGLRWLNKAVLRGAGVLPLHDEAKAFASQAQALRAEGATPHRAIDFVAFVTTFKTVVLEGIEVVFVVVALGAKPGLIGPAAAGAGLAMLLVIALGVLLHRPLATVPENTLKFAVGAMLSAFGTYWAGEGIGLAWPGSDLAILPLIVFFVALGLALSKLCAPGLAPASASAAVRTAAMPVAVHPPGRLASVAAELFGLFVDDLWLAVGILVWVAAAALLQASHPPEMTPGCVLFTAGLAMMLVASAFRRARVNPR